MHYILHPETPGETGDKTIMDTTTHPSVVTSLHIVFQGWMGDDLMECFPCFMVTEKLKQRLQQLKATGFIIQPCQVEVSPEFLLMQPGVILPPIYWLQVGHHPDCDMFINHRHNLVITQKLYQQLADVNLHYCDAEQALTPNGF